MNRLILLAVPILFAIGCSASHLDGDKFELTTPWYSIVIAVGLGVALAVLGVLLIIGRLKPKGKPRTLGVMSLIIGVAITASVATTLPYKRVIITPDRFQKQWGTFGERIVEVDLDQVIRLVLYLSNRFPRDHPKHSARPKHTFVQFDTLTGNSIHVRLSGIEWVPALDHLIAVAKSLNIEIDDQRKDVPRFRINNPFD